MCSDTPESFAVILCVRNHHLIWHFLLDFKAAWLLISSCHSEHYNRALRAWHSALATWATSRCRMSFQFHAQKLAGYWASDGSLSHIPSIGFRGRACNDMHSHESHNRSTSLHQAKARSLMEPQNKQTDQMTCNSSRLKSHSFWGCHWCCRMAVQLVCKLPRKVLMLMTDMFSLSHCCSGNVQIMSNHLHTIPYIERYCHSITACVLGGIEAGCKQILAWCTLHNTPGGSTLLVVEEGSWPGKEHSWRPQLNKRIFRVIGSFLHMIPVDMIIQYIHII